MKREIQIALVSKPKEDTEYDEFRIQNKVKQLQEANSLFDKDLSTEEQMKLTNIEIKKPENKANTNKNDKRKFSDLNDLSCSFELNQPQKTIKLDNDRKHVNSNIACKEQNFDGKLKTESDYLRHMKKRHGKDPEKNLSFDLPITNETANE